MILTLLWLAPLVVGLLLVPVTRREVLLGAWTALALGEVVLAVLAWRGVGGTGFAHEVALPWIPAFGVGYHVGVDGLSAPLVAMTAVVFLAVALYSLRRDPAGDGDDDPRRLRGYVLLFLGLEAASLGLFVALDLGGAPGRGRAVRCSSSSTPSSAPS